MIISLDRRIFKTHPDNRFAKKKKLRQGFLTLLYYKYNVLGYTLEEVAEYFTFKTTQRMDRQNAELWMKRVEAYILAQRALKMGAKEVNVNYFGRTKHLVLRDIKQNDIRTSETA